MNKCPFCNILLVDNKCKSCGFSKSLEELEKIEKLKRTRERFQKIFEEEDDSEIDLSEKISKVKDNNRVLFDEDSTTTPQEVTGLNKLVIPLEPLESEKATIDLNKKKFDEDSPTIPQHTVELNNLEIKEKVRSKKENPMLSITKDTKEKLNPFTDKVNKLDNSYKNKKIIKENNISRALEEKKILEDKKLKEQIEKEEKSFIVAGFFKRTLIALMDQFIILVITYLFFITMIKPELKIIYTSFEAIASFILDYQSQFYTLIFAYLAINFIYYTLFNIIFGGTPISRLFGYKLYKNDKKLSIIVILIRNIMLLALNILFLLPYLIIFVSDFKQSLYDKMFKTYLAKEVK